jgi:hypothetical protein
MLIVDMMVIMTRLHHAAAAVIAALHHPMRAKLYAFIGSSQRSWEWVRDPADTPG